MQPNLLFRPNRVGIPFSIFLGFFVAGPAPSPLRLSAPGSSYSLCNRATAASVSATAPLATVGRPPVRVRS
jgi:hypothetical protein